MSHDEHINLNANRNPNALRVFIVGFGGIALAHARAIELSPNVQLVGFSTSDPKIQRGDCRHVKCNLGVEGFLFDTTGMIIRRNWLDALQEFFDSIDAFIVCVPTMFHAEIACLIGKAGKHCYLEKPIANTAFKANCILDAFEGSQGKLVVGQELAAFPTFNFPYELLKQNPVSMVKKLTLRRHVPWLVATGHDDARPSQIATTTGFVADLIVHDINLVLHWNNPDSFQIVDAQYLHGKMQWLRCQFFHSPDTIVTMDVGAAMEQSEAFAHSWNMELWDDPREGSRFYWYDGKDVWQSSRDNVAQKVEIECMTTPQVFAKTLGIFADYCTGRRDDSDFLDPYKAYKTMQVIDQIVGSSYKAGELKRLSLGSIFPG